MDNRALAAFIESQGNVKVAEADMATMEKQGMATGMTATHPLTGAQVPVVCAYFHYPDKTIGIGPALTMSGDLERDMATVREFYRPFQGKHRGTT